MTKVENVKVFAMSPPATDDDNKAVDQSKLSNNEVLFAKLNSVFDEQNDIDDRKSNKLKRLKEFFNFEEIAAKRDDYSILIFHKDNR